MKYKVGDKVKVRNDLVVNETYGDGCRFRSDMARYKGQVVTISRVFDVDGFYKIKDDFSNWSWVDEMFEDVVENKKYKIGDKVKIREDLIADEEYGEINYISDMDKWKGKIVTISFADNDNNCYGIAEDTEGWNWSAEMFEDVSMKYKIGDRVRVRKDLVHGKGYGGQTFYMDDWKGKVVTISSINSHGYYEIAGDGDVWWWTDEMFEDVSDVPTDGRVQTVDVGYYLAFCGHGVLVDVYQDGSHDENSFFTSVDGFNQYIIPKDAIKWIIPHEKEIDL